MNEYKAYENQSLYDVASHVYGNSTGVMDLALLNNLSLDAMLVAGQNLKLIDAPTTYLVKKSLESRAIIPATSLTSQEVQIILLPPVGIGTMIIETNFEVT